jgi:hypothetical protein
LGGTITMEMLYIPRGLFGGAAVGRAEREMIRGDGGSGAPSASARYANHEVTVGRSRLLVRSLPVPKSEAF